MQTRNRPPAHRHPTSKPTIFKHLPTNPKIRCLFLNTYANRQKIALYFQTLAHRTKGSVQANPAAHPRRRKPGGMNFALPDCHFANSPPRESGPTPQESKSASRHRSHSASNRSPVHPACKLNLHVFPSAVWASTPAAKTADKAAGTGPGPRLLRPKYRPATAPVN